VLQDTGFTPQDKKLVSRCGIIVITGELFITVIVICGSARARNGHF